MRLLGSEIRRLTSRRLVRFSLLVALSLVIVLVVIVTAGVTGFLVAWIDKSAVDWIVLAIAVVVFARWVLVPFLRWLTTEYTVTNRRLITRSGILTRKGHDIPIPRISDVAARGWSGAYATGD